MCQSWEQGGPKTPYCPPAWDHEDKKPGIPDCSLGPRSRCAQTLLFSNTFPLLLQRKGLLFLPLYGECIGNNNRKSGNNGTFYCLLGALRAECVVGQSSKKALPPPPPWQRVSCWRNCACSLSYYCFIFKAINCLVGWLVMLSALHLNQLRSAF